MFPLQKDEKVLKYVRRHWIWLFIESKIAFIVFLIPTLLVIYFANYTSFGNKIIFGITGFALSNVFISMWAIFCWIYMAERFTEYALNFWVLTNQRIVECELNGLFNTKINTMEIEDVEDASVTTPGFFAQFFGFGTLQIQSAGAAKEFIAEHIKDPEAAKEMVFALKAKIKDENIVTAEEIEEIFTRNKVVNNMIPSDSILPSKKDLKTEENVLEKDTEGVVFDWANIAKKQAEDIRNKIEEIEKVDDEFKKDVSNALRS